MSNQLAFATLTFALQRLLNRIVGADVSGAVATAYRPDGTDGTLPTVGVNIYLLQANPTGEAGNIDLPTRNHRREIIERPTAVYELIYLLTFHGAETKLEPQRVQASVLRYLHTAPSISKRFIREQIAAAVSAEPNHYLRGSNLADQDCVIKITPFKLSLEDLSKVWSVFFQTNYVLTSTFRATYVLLDTEEAGQASLPVRMARTYALPMGEMMIDRVAPDRVAYGPAVDVTLIGEGLTGSQKKVLVDDEEAALQSGSTASAAIVRLPATLRAGVKRVRVVDQAPLGASHRGTESNMALFLLLPTVNTIIYVPDPSVRKDHTIRVETAMSVGLDQRVSLLLNSIGPPAAGKPTSYSLAMRPRTAETDPLIFAAREVASGTYMYRIRVDEVDSELTLDTSDPDPAQHRFVGPTVVVP